MYRVDVYLRVRRAVMVEGVSIREAARTFGLHRDTVRKMLAYSVPPGYRRQAAPRKPKLEPCTGIIDHILDDDHRVPRKQRHTAKRIFERLRDEYGFDGGYTIVKDHVREHRRQTKEMFVPLSHTPGHAQCDFGEAFLGGVPRSILYDNTRLAVAKILGDGRRQRTRAFTELQSHHLFEDRFGRPGKGNDKGKVEGLVGYARRNFLVPIPSFESFVALNAHLERRCLERMDAQLRGHTESIGQRMERDLEDLLPLPSVPYDACEKQAGRVSSLSLVRYKTNDYSLLVAYGHRDVLVRGYVDRVVISCGSEVIARHRRSYERDDFVYDPIHYLPLLEQKTGALDQAAPLQGWLTRGVRHPETTLGVPHGPAGQAGVRAGAQALGNLLPRRGVCRSEGRSPAGCAELRRRQAPGAVPVGGTAATPRPGTLSLPAQSEGQHHLRQGLHEPVVREGGMSQRSTLLLEHHLKELRLVQLPERVWEAGRSVRRRGCGPPGVPAAPSRTGTHRPPPAHGGAAHPGGEIPGSEELGHLRLPSHPLGEQGPGAGTGPL